MKIYRSDYRSDRNAGQDYAVAFRVRGRKSARRRGFGSGTGQQQVAAAHEVGVPEREHLRESPALRILFARQQPSKHGREVQSAREAEGAGRTEGEGQGPLVQATYRTRWERGLPSPALSGYLGGHCGTSHCQARHRHLGADSADFDGQK